MTPDARSIPVRSPPDDEPHPPHAARFLSRASGLLASSLDVDETLRNVAEAAVPDFADWCAVDLRAPDGELRRVAVAHPDPSFVRLAHELQERWPPRRDGATGAARVVRTGESILMQRVEEAQLDAMAQDDEHRAVIRRLGVRSLITVAIPAAGGALGAITFALTEKAGRLYEPRDLVVAEELARRAAVAVDRARLHGEAQAGRERLRAILDGIDGIVWEAEPETLRFTFVSQQAESILGYPVERWLSEPDFWVRHIHPRDREWAHEFCATRTRRGEDHEFEYRMVAADGRVVWLLDKVFLERDAQGRVAHARGLMVDITERKNAERRFAAQHQVTTILNEARSLDEAAPHLLRVLCEQLEWDVAGLWRAEGDGLVLAEMGSAQDVDAAPFAEASRALRLARGRGLPGRVLESGRAEWIRDVRRDGNFPRAADAERLGLRGAVAFPVWGSVGVVGVVELFARETREPDGILMGFMDTLGWQMGQYLQRKSAEAAVRETNARRGAILGASLDGIVTIDAGGTVTEWNPAAERIFGWSRDEAVGRALADLIVPPSMRAAHREGLARAVRTGRTSLLGKRMEMPAIHRDGHEFPVELAIIQIPGTNPPEFTGFIRDVTDRKRASESLRFQAALLESQMEAMPVALLVVSPEGRIISWNGRFTDLWNATDAEVDDAPVEEILERMLARATPESVEALGSVATHPDAPSRFEIRLAEGHVLDVHGAPVRGEDGAYHGRIWTFRDITERQAVEEALRQSEKRYRFLADAVPEQVWTATPEGALDYVNRRVVDYFARDAAEVVRAGWQAFVHEEDLDETLARWRKALAEGAAYEAEFRMRRHDGAYRWFIARALPLRDEAGRVVKWFGANADITENKHAQAALAARAEELSKLAAELEYQRDLTRTITDNAASALFMMDKDGHPTFLNPAALAMTGYGSLDEIRDKPLHDAVHFRKPDGSPYPMEECPIDQANAEIVPLKDQREIFCRKDGTLFPVSYNVAPVAKDGTRLGAVLEVRDITREVAAEEELKRRAEELGRLAEELANQRNLIELITDNATSCLFMMDDAGRPTYMNPEAERVTGFKLDEIRHLELHDAIHHTHPDGSDFPVEQCPLDRAHERTAVLRDHRDVFTRKDGSQFHALSSIVPIERDGRPIGAVVELRDITPLVEAEEQLKQHAMELAALAAALERSNRELDQFAYVTSHDLKAPLRGIANLATWIEEDLGDAVDEEAHKHLDLLRGRVHRMEALIDAILQYSRVGRIKLRPEPVDVGELLQEATDLLSPPDGFVIDVQGKMPEVVAERSRLQQVFMNLIGNAVKHHHDPARGRVTISVEDAGDAYAFTVADNGPGIAPRFHEKVFVIFQTLEARDKVEGTGVGLALVKKIVQTQGGTITLESDEGRGATFRFTWPKQPPA